MGKGRAPTAARPLPDGTVTFVFTDIEGSTNLLRRLRSRYGEMITEHARLIREALAKHDGWEVDTQGDAFFCAFNRAGDAVAFAVSLQRAIAEIQWPEQVTVRIRIGIHTGEPDISDQRYYGLDVHRTARICSAARGGEVLLSHLTAALVRDQVADDVSLAERGIVQLKDFPEPTPIYALHIPGVSESTASADVLRPTPFEGAEEALAARVAERQAADTEPAETDAGLEVLLVSDSIGGVEEMVGFTRLAAPGRTLRRMILTCIVNDQDDVLPTTRNLVGLRNHLAASGLPVRVAAFHTSDAGDAIEKLVLRQEIGLVVANAVELIVAGDDTLSLGILRAAPCDVALHLFRQDASTAGPLLVPFSGSDHDWAALELATTLAVASGRTLVVTGTAGRESETGDASRLLASASLIAQQLGGIIAEPLLIPRGADAIVEAAAGASHLITGVPVDYEQRGIGRTRREIARRTPAAVTFIRRGRRTGVISPDRTVTQFAWTCTQPV